MVVASECRPSAWREVLPNPFDIKCPKLCIPGQRRFAPCTQGCTCGFLPGRHRSGRLYCTPSVLRKIPTKGTYPMTL
ncbi:hypothetical protein V5799_016637 [Amblyomma americanum]|uniref:Uncharacterized protein n=1 Tax=Amblyomma americanum TaxID=6943 RepID=A0AAQ4F596_AMBAM